jgi:hypothetical protein
MDRSFKICATDTDYYQKALLKIGKRQVLSEWVFVVLLTNRKHIIKSKRKDYGMLKRTCGIFASLAIFFIAANAMAQDLDVTKGSWWMDESVVKAPYVAKVRNRLGPERFERLTKLKRY